MYIVSQDGTCDFTSLQAAVDAIPEEAGPEDRTIWIRNGVYQERVIVHRSHLRILGESAEGVVLTGSAFALQIHPDGTERTTFRHPDDHRKGYSGGKSDRPQ